MGMKRDGIQIHIEVTYNGRLIARDDAGFVAGARRYIELRREVARALRARHGDEVTFAMMVGSLRGPRADRIKAMAAGGPVPRPAPVPVPRPPRQTPAHSRVPLP